MAMYRSILCLVFVLGYLCYGGTAAAKTRILVVSSYHKEYLWSQDTNRGVCAAFIEFGYMDGEEQCASYSNDDRVENSTTVIRKLWMDTKRKSSRAEISRIAERIAREARAFKPDIMLLGDDNATRYIGRQFLDGDIPVVFWGVNDSPLKYGLIDSIARPGHNVTGVYQAGYLKEAVEMLVGLLPGVKRLGVLSDDSPSGRAKVRKLRDLAEQGLIPVTIAGIEITNSLAQWKYAALDLARNVDAFFILNHNTIKDENGQPVKQLELGAWYLRHVRKPDIGHERQFVQEGLLSAVDDSGFNQGFEAVRLAHRIISEGVSPAELPVYAPERGRFMVNLERARMLGLEDVVRASPLVEEVIERAEALAQYP